MGTGIRRINDALAEYDLPEAIFEYDENNFAIIFELGFGDVPNDVPNDTEKRRCFIMVLRQKVWNRYIFGSC